MKEERKLLEQFQSLNKELDQIYARLRKRSGLSTNEFLVMLKVREGYTSQSEISKELYINKQTINSSITKLQKMEFLELVPCVTNHRIKNIKLKEKGIRFSQKYIDCVNEAEIRVFNTIDINERKQAINFFVKYNSMLNNEANKILQENTDLADE